jgi:predicted O-linked N-acetylglucosamine transferase (SPINDLY family)
MRSLVTEWREVFNLSDQMLAERIREDRIDILVDLAGFTRDSRLLAFTARPAPIQMTYIGYPNTTGLPAIDYRITDWIADPEGVDDDYTETLIRLPGCFLNYAIPAHAPPVKPGPCEERGHVTFGSFNNFAKINPKLLALWAEVLHAVPDSRILFKSTSSADPTAQKVIRNELECLGIDTARVTFSAFKPTAQDHLDVYNEIDIALDTFPYNGTTTTCEALWMGVPVITLRGDRHVSRVGASLLSTIGFPAGIAEDKDEYVTTARLLAENPGLLGTARRNLRSTIMRSSLCDNRGHAATLEQAFRAVWQIWCEQQN